MRLRERDGTLEVEDVPGMHWLLGLLFVGVGGLFVAGPLGLMPDAGQLRWWVRVLTVAMGSLSVSVGGWTLARAPRSRLILDSTRGRLRLERWSVGGREVREWPLAALTAVQVVEQRDDEGGAVFQVHLHLRGARPTSLSPVWHHGRERTERVAQRLAGMAGVRATNVRAAGV